MGVLPPPSSPMATSRMASKRSRSVGAVGMPASVAATPRPSAPATTQRSTSSLGGKGGSGDNGGNVTVALYNGNGVATLARARSAFSHKASAEVEARPRAIRSPSDFRFPSTRRAPSTRKSTWARQALPGGGGDVSVTVAAPVATQGGDATGVLAQSIGGGGGLGGSAGSDASADNPFVAGLNGRQAISNIANFFQALIDKKDGKVKFPFTGTFDLSIGGTGGQGGNGGSVDVKINAPITTKGDWAGGVIAQSIGGGGGKGGTAASAGTGGIPSVTINLDMAVGGSGGGAGDGGAVEVNLNQGSSISTAGSRCGWPDRTVDRRRRRHRRRRLRQRDRRALGRRCPCSARAVPPAMAARSACPTRTAHRDLDHRASGGRCGAAVDREQRRHGRRRQQCLCREFRSSRES